jgi:Na+/H+ antiporter NhaD/arsenite permease-like protein
MIPKSYLYVKLLGMSSLGEKLPLISILPFAGILLSISLFPIIAPRFWHKHFGKISLFWAILSALPLLYLSPKGTFHEILHVLLAEYIPFILLLSSLYIISGNIYLQGNFSGTPLFNTIYLLTGTLLASLMGTTGASIVLIRPLLRANAWRKNKAYIFVFFIFLVSNIGGSLTPLGDPPLFLGFLKGVPFFWTLNLFPSMLLCVFFLLVLFYLIDTINFKKEKERFPKDLKKKTFLILGWYNLFFLVGVPITILLSANFHLPGIHVFGIERPLNEIFRDIFFVLLAGVSFFITPREIREKNEFTLFPIKEVAILFFGIFIAMLPAISILQAGERGVLNPLISKLNEPAHYFWITGLLSAFLDNAPTYLTFLSTCLGKFYPGLPEKEAIVNLIQNYPKYLLAISEGAVFFGALTYIGNAPNFMVRSIAEEKGITMPSFFGYLLKYSIPILIPLFILLTLIFYRG